MTSPFFQVALKDQVKRLGLHSHKGLRPRRCAPFRPCRRHPTIAAEPSAARVGQARFVRVSHPWHRSWSFACQQRPGGSGHVGLSHQPFRRLQEGPYAALRQPLAVPLKETDAAFRPPECARRAPSPPAVRKPKRHLEGAQIAVVDTNEPAFDFQRTGPFRPFVITSIKAAPCPSLCASPSEPPGVIITDRGQYNQDGVAAPEPEASCTW